MNRTLLRAAGAAASGRVRGRAQRTGRRALIAERRGADRALDEAAAGSGRPWNVRAAVMLERPPVVIEEPAEWEMDMWRLQHELGAKNQPELPVEFEDGPRSETGEGSSDAALPDPPILAPRKTKADRTGDRSTWLRALDTRLFFVVRGGAGGDGWHFPAADWAEGETIRETAERALVGACGAALLPELHWPSNAPQGHWNRQAASPGDAHFGDKTFYLRTWIVDPYETGVNLEGTAEHAWATRAELQAELGGGAESDGFADYIQHVLPGPPWYHEEMF